MREADLLEMAFPRIQIFRPQGEVIALTMRENRLRAVANQMKSLTRPQSTAASGSRFSVTGSMSANTGRARS